MGRTSSIIVCVILAVAFVFAIFGSTILLAKKPTSSENVPFKGCGTSEEPYEISSRDDLLKLAQIVNAGERFDSVYFKQTCNIDLNGIDWEPIGFSDAEDTISFWGYYDGNGCYISSLTLSSGLNRNASALFGRLGGVISNLGIESGVIYGGNAGSFAALSAGSNARIVNCYNKAEIHGETIGGIAGSLADGTIANCLNAGYLDGDVAFGIVGKYDNTKVYSCFATTQIMSTSSQTSIGSSTSHVLDESQLFSPTNALKLNAGALISRYLFLGDTDLSLLRWSFQNESVCLSPFGIALQFIDFANYWLLPFIVTILLCVYLRKRQKLGPRDFRTRYRPHVIIHSIAFSVIVFFSDAFLLMNPKCTHAGQILFLLLIHTCSALAIVYCIHTRQKGLHHRACPAPMLFVIAVVVLLELIQFGIIPRYDANIYYGSLIRGCQLFNYDLFSYIGAFCCWKWIQGLVLIVAPFEFLMPGQTVGIYIANVVVTIVTMICLRTLLRELYESMSEYCAAICSGIFCASPYILGMFTYFALDWHLAFFAIWLFFAMHKRNDSLIVYCGFLLCFTKATGAIVYACLLLSHTVIQCVHDARRSGSLIKSIAEWWRWSRVLFWILPAVLLLFTFKYGDHFVAQEFAGAFTPTSLISIGDANQIINTSLHAFVFGFRWLFIFALIVAAILGAKQSLLNSEAATLLLAIAITFVATFCVLCVYNSNANCPRYTTVFAAAYAVLLPYALLVLLREELPRRLCSTGILTILLFQSFFTFDPSIMLYCKPTPIGHTSLYRLAYNEDDRPGMNLHGNSSDIFTAICDLYAYNFEYNFYDSLLDESFSKIDINPQLTIYSLNVSTYEINISGRYPYEILYNSITGDRTYNYKDADAQVLRIAELDLFETGAEEAQREIEKLPNHFYLIIPYRAYEDTTIGTIRNAGYIVKKDVETNNLYGNLVMYEFQSTK